MMVTISSVVDKLVDNNIFLQEAINQGIIAYNNLAKTMKEEIEKEVGSKVNLNTIVMALRRYKDKVKEESYKDLTLDFVSEISFKGDISYILLHKKPLMLLRPVLIGLRKTNENAILNVIQGNEEVGIVFNSRFRDKILFGLKSKDIIKIHDNLTMISINYAKEINYTPGIIYEIVRFITWQDIEVYNVFHTPTQLSLLVKNDRAMDCYNALMNLVKNEEKSLKRLEIKNK